MRLTVLVTGQTERLGLGEALKRLFPAHALDVEVRPVDGVTSSRLPVDAPVRSLRGAPGAALRMVAQLAAEAVDARNRRHVDLVVALDDLELENADQPTVVSGLLRRAVQEHLRELRERRGDEYAERVARALRERAAFHLARPMVEAWFFADPAAIGRAGAAWSEVRIASGDPESFEAVDPAFLQADVTACCQVWAARGADPKARPRWDRRDRSRHPKGYLQWLARDAEHRTCTRYVESEGGAEALAQLDWPLVLGRPTTELGCLRALVAELADVLGVPTPGGPPPDGVPTARARTLRDSVLRNL